MTKIDLIESLRGWLNDFLHDLYSKDYYLETIIPENNLSRLPNSTLKKINGYTALDFHPDVICLMTHKTTQQIESIIMNVTTTAISLKEIGEMNCYSKILKSKHSFIVSSKGLPEEVNLILLNNKTLEKLLKIDNTNYIHIFRWDEKLKSIDLNTLFPLKNNSIVKQ